MFTFEEILNEASGKSKSSKTSNGLDFDKILAENTEPPKRTVLGTLGDIGVTAGKSIISTGEALVGAADIPTFGYAGKSLDLIGYDPKHVHKKLFDLYSDPQKEAFKKVEEAKGFKDTLVASIENPSTIAHSVLESIPLMLGGAGIGRGIIKAGAKIAPYAAGAIGEGAVAAGSMAEQTRQDTETGTLSGKQVAQSVGSGIGTGIIGAVGGRIAQKLGIGDIDTLLVKGKFAEKSSKGVVRKILEGGITEGFFEELPQSIQEQIWSNAALGKPLMEDVGKAGATGMLAGAVMGGGANIFTQGKEFQQERVKNKQVETSAKNIISNGTEVIHEAITQIDERINKANVLLNNPEMLEAEAVERDISVEDLTNSLNEQIDFSTQLQERLKKEIGLDTETKPIETVPAETVPTETKPTNVEETKTEDDLYWEQQEKEIEEQRARQDRMKEVRKSLIYQMREGNQEEINRLWKEYEKEQAEEESRKAQRPSPDLAGRERQKQIDKLWWPAEQELDEKHNRKIQQLKELTKNPEEKIKIAKMLSNFYQRITNEKEKVSNNVPILDSGKVTDPRLIETPTEQKLDNFLTRAIERLGGKVEPDVIFDKEKYRKEVLDELENESKNESSTFTNEQQLEVGPNDLYAGILIDVKVISENGTIATLKDQDAKEVLDDIDKQKSIYTRLLECLVA